MPTSQPDIDSRVRLHVLMPGDVVCAERGDRMQILLGSCITIVLTDALHSVATACHIVFHCANPTRVRTATSCAEVALARMYSMLRARGVTPESCSAYVIGGGNMFPALVSDGDVGQRNAAWAFERLYGDGIPVVLAEVGGPQYRRMTWLVGPDAPRIETVPVPKGL